MYFYICLVIPTYSKKYPKYTKIYFLYISYIFRIYFSRRTFSCVCGESHRIGHTWGDVKLLFLPSSPV